MEKYSKEEQFQIGREISETSLTVMDAAAKYNVNYYTARNYLRMYKSMKKLRPDAAEKMTTEREMRSGKHV